MLRRTGFKTKQKTPLRRTPLRAKKKAKRTKLPAVTTMRNKCDKLLTPIIKEMYPVCLLRGSTTCNYYTQVAHHHVHKSRSSRLRYDIENLIPLCHACHKMLHHDESFWGAKVAQIKGSEWFQYIEKAKQETVKTDVHFYLAEYKKLSQLE